MPFTCAPIDHMIALRVEIESLGSRACTAAMPDMTVPIRTAPARTGPAIARFRSESFAMFLSGIDSAVPNGRQQFNIG